MWDSNPTPVAWEATVLTNLTNRSNISTSTLKVVLSISMLCKVRIPYLLVSSFTNKYNRLPLKTCWALAYHTLALLLPYRFTYTKYHHNYFWANRKGVFVVSLTILLTCISHIGNYQQCLVFDMLPNSGACGNWTHLNFLLARQATTPCSPKPQSVVESITLPHFRCVLSLHLDL